MSEKDLLLERLDEMIRLLHLNVTQRPYIDQTYAVSQSRGFFLDYKERKHLYIFSHLSLTLAIGTIGSLTVPANTWTDISFPPNLQVFAVGQATATLVLVRATDETINGASNGADTNINLNQVNGTALSNANPVPVSQIVGGAAISATNPEINISNIEQLILNGQAFSCSTDFQTAAAAMAGEIFFPATNTKNIILWSARAAYTNATQFIQSRYITAVDPNIDAGTSVAGQVLNLGGGAAPTSGFSFKYASGVTAPAVSAASVPLSADNTAQNQTTEIFAPGEFRYIPPGVAGGIAVYHNTTAAGKWGLTFRWVEF